MREIWKESSGHLVEKALDDSQVLTLLADVLGAVAGLQIFRPESPEWDEFTELLLPKAKRFVQSIQPSDYDLQHQRTALQVLLHLVEIYGGCSKSLQEILRIGPLPDVRDVIVKLLNRRDTSYLVKADTLNVLAQFSRSTSVAASDQSSNTQLLIDTLGRFMAEEFPIVSTDVKYGTKEYDVYSLLFRQLLLIIEESRCVKFLQLLYSSLREGSHHLFARDLSRGLARFAEKLASTGAVAGGANNARSEAADLLELTELLLDTSVDVVIRKTLLESVFTPLMELQNAEVMKTFFLAEIKSSSKVVMISKLLTLIANLAEISSPGSFFSAAVAFALVELLFRLADPEFVRNEINAAFLGHSNGKGREFTMLICKCASKMVTKAYGDVNDMIRFACCEAYNCLLTAVSKTQKQEKFFDQILFQEALWGNIIDISQEYDLRAETGQFVKIPLSSLSASTLKAQQHTQDVSSRSKHGKLSRDASSALQFFTGSSLSQIVSLESITTQSFAEQHLATTGLLYRNLEIELDAINDHSSMIPLLRVMILMKDEFGANWDSKSMPSWMQKIFNVVANSLTELNIRLFLVKMVLNVPELFTLYAPMWLEKIIDTVLEATNSVSSGKEPEFNYLLRDCCNLILGEWKDVPHISLKAGTMSRFLATLIELSPHTVNMIMQDNILLVTQLIVLWKDLVTIDVSTIEKFLFSNEPDSHLEVAKRVTALQLLSAMLEAGALDEIQAEMPSVFGRSITDGILLALQHKRVTVYTVAAEVGGLGLHHFQSKSNAFARALAEEIVKAYNNEDYGRFFALLRNVSLHQPKFIDPMMLQRLCSVLPKVISIDAWSRLASESLENASKNAEVAQLLFPSIQPVLNRFINHRDAGVQYATLRVMDSISEALGKSELELLIKSSMDGGIGLLYHYGNHAEAGCRKLMYFMAMRFFRKAVSSSSLKDSLRQILLGGLSDSDPDIREELFVFWNESDLIPSSSSQRLVELFHSLHSPELADKWVFYATNLLVLMARGTAHYDAPLFSSPLTKSEFHDTEIDVAWEGKTQTMAPMFSVESDTFAAKMSSLSDTGNLSQSFLAIATQNSLTEGSIHQSQLISANLGTYIKLCFLPSIVSNLVLTPCIIFVVQS